MGENDIIDLPDAMDRVQNDKELFLELLGIFQEDFVIKRQALEGAVAAGDIAKIKEIAHSIKGASGNISARPLYQNCLQLEQLAKSNSTNGMPALLKSIDVQFQQVKDYTETLKKQWVG